MPGTGDTEVKESLLICPSGTNGLLGKQTGQINRIQGGEGYEEATQTKDP